MDTSRGVACSVATFPQIRPTLAERQCEKSAPPRGEALRKFLKLERTKAELTQAQLAERLGWNQKTILNIERGQHRVKLIEIIELGEVLGFDPAKVVRKIANVRDP